jgi:hypothetical protein
VKFCVLEHYTSQHPDFPKVVSISGPDGMTAASHDEMLDLLGIPRSQPPVSIDAPKLGPPSESTASSESHDGNQETLGDQIDDPFIDNAGEEIEEDIDIPSMPKEFPSKDPLELLGWHPDIGGSRRPRRVRVGNHDITILEYRQNASDKHGLPARRWFEAPNGIKTRGYYEMLDALGARPKPLLPEDEDRPELPSMSDHERRISKPRQQEREAVGELSAMPLGGRSLEELTEIEETMQLIWLAESYRESDPDLYEAALDSVKREAYMEKHRQEKEEERVLEEELKNAPRCEFVKLNGEHCGSFAEGRGRYCYFHSRTAEGRTRKKRKGPLTIPVLEDDLAVQMAVTHICRGVAEESLEPKRASILLYGLQVATVALRQKKATREEEVRQ